MNTLPLKGYKTLITADGSPSLEWAATGECMHNRQGALSESLFIYGSAIAMAFEHISHPRFLSVGLGLSYVEIIVACWSLKKENFDWTLESYEKDSQLLESWSYFLKGLPSPLDTTYLKILNLCCKHFDIAHSDLLEALHTQYQKGAFQLKGLIDDKTEWKDPFNVIIFDPFSAKTDSPCWQQDFLNSFFRQVCASDCIVSSYAAKGVLTRTLKSLDFQVTLPEGFGGKRNRTLAYRGLFCSL